MEREYLQAQRHAQHFEEVVHGKHVTNVPHYIGARVVESSHTADISKELDGCSKQRKGSPVGGPVPQWSTKYNTAVRRDEKIAKLPSAQQKHRMVGSASDKARKTDNSYTKRISQFKASPLHVLCAPFWEML